MKEAKSITIVTIISAITFCALIIFASLSPLTTIGENANQFNSLEMWLSIAFVITSYLIPLMLYYIYPKLGKIMLAICCGIGVIIFLSSFAIFILLGFVLKMMSSLITILVICSIGVMINIIWFAVAYTHRQNTNKDITYQVVTK